MSAAALIIAGLDAVFWVLAGASYLFSQSDPATRGLDQGAAAVVTVLFVVTALPALVLASRRRAPRTAFILSLAFPAIFSALFVAVLVMLP